MPYDAELHFASRRVRSGPYARLDANTERFCGESTGSFASVRSLLLAILVLAGCPGSPDRARPVDIDTAIGTVEAVEGEATVVHEQRRIAAAAGVSLVTGDRLETGAQGKMRVRLRDQSVLAIGAVTRLALADLVVDEATRNGRIDVTLGRFWMNVTKWSGSGASSYEIHTPNAVAGVRGTTLWGDTEVDAICALEGTIEVRSLKTPSLEPATLTAGNCASALSEGKLAPLSPTSEQIQEYLGEVLIRTK